MADVKMPEFIPCRFDMGYAGKCGCPSDNGLCSKHEAVKCCVCGTQATRECDHATSLVCSAPLCDSCKHSPKGAMAHVTGEKAAEIEEQMARKDEALRASRTSPDRRMDPLLDIPANLFELLKGDWKGEGYERANVYYLKLHHGLAGFFPALFDREKDHEGEHERFVITTDLRVLESVWKMLEPREAKIVETTAYLHPTNGYAYVDGDGQHEQEGREPLKILTRQEFDMMDKSDDPFRWAYGLISAHHPQMDEFLKDLARQAQKFDSTFGQAA